MSLTSAFRRRRVRICMLAVIGTCALLMPAQPAAHATSGSVREHASATRSSTHSAPARHVLPTQRGSTASKSAAGGVPSSGTPVVPASYRALLARIPRRLYDPVGSDGVSQHRLLGIASAVGAGTPAPDYAGESLDTRSGLLDVYLTSTSATARGQALARVPAADRGLVRFRQAPRSLASLTALMRTATADIRGLLARGIRVRAWAPDFRRGVISVTLYKPTPAQAAQARGALAAIPATFSTTTVALEANSAVRPHAKAAPTATEPACPSPFTQGVNSACDAAPLSGADFIASNSGFCTDSWPVMIGSTYYMLTAGHCSNVSNGAGSNGSVFTNEGIDGSTVTFGSGSFIGTGQQNGLNSTPSSIDAQLIPWQPGSSAFLPQVWSGNTAGNVASSTPLPVIGAETPPDGTTICADGAYDGLNCGGTVSSTSGCQTAADDGTAMFCDLLNATTSSGILAGAGDSGGPWFVMSGSGADAVGLDSLGGTGSNCPAYTGRGAVCSNNEYLTSITAILSHYGATMVPPVVDISGGGTFAQTWAAQGSAMGSLGEPATAEAGFSGGQQQLFQNGAIYWSPSHNTHAIYGAGYDKYSSLGGTASALSVLTTDNLNPAGGGDEWQFAGTSCTAANSPNGTGSAIIGPSTQPPHGGTAYEVQGCIYQYYEANHGTSGPYGYPTKDEQAVYNSSNTQIGRVSYFAGSSAPSCSTGSEPGGGTTAAIYWNPTAQATHGVNGCIFAEYHAQGEAGGPLGFPTDDAYSYNGGHRQDFQNGSIVGSNGSYSVTTGNWVVGHAAHAGNDYPYETVGQFEHQSEGTDAWNEYYGQCDSFAAWKVYENLAGNAAQPPSSPVPAVGWRPSNASISPVNQDTWYNADNWDVKGRAAWGTQNVNTIPAPGTIAYWPNATTDPQDGHPTSPNGIGGFGHVGYVTDVYPDGSITIEGYNLRVNGEYSVIHLPYGGSATDTSFNHSAFTVPWPTYFIHVGDGIGSGTPASPEPANGTVSSGYPSQVKVIGPGSSGGQFSLNSVWYSDAGHGEIGQEEYTHTNGATADSTATWTPSGLAGSTCYRVDALVPDNYSDNPVAVYSVDDSQGSYTAAVNENAFTNDWAELGVYETNSGGGGLTVRLDDRGTTGRYVAADAMRFWRQASCGGHGDVAPIMMPGTKNGTWAGYPGHGFFGSMAYASTSGSLTSSGANAGWLPTLLPSTCYEVSAYVPDNFSDNNAARYEVLDDYFGTFWPQVNENVFTNQFAPIGGFRSTSSGQLEVVETNMGPGGQYVAADAVAFTPDPGCQGPAGNGLGAPYASDVIGPGSSPAYFTTTSTWYSQLGHGDAYHELWTHDNGTTPDSTATWIYPGAANTCYSLWVYVPDNYADNPSAHYTFSTNLVGSASTIDQNTSTGFTWLAAIRTGSAGTVKVTLNDTGVTGDYTAADAIEFAANGYGC